MGPTLDDVIFYALATAVGLVGFFLAFILLATYEMWGPRLWGHLMAFFNAVYQTLRPDPKPALAGDTYDEGWEYEPPPAAAKPVVTVLPPPVMPKPQDVLTRQPITPPQPLAVPVRAVESSYTPVQEWVAELFDLSAHIVILAGSGCGKTRTTRGLTRHIVQKRRERVIILDPKANRDTWMGLTAVSDADEINQRMRELLQEFDRRLKLNPTLTEAEAEATFERIWIIVDEVGFINDNCKVWQHFLRRISSMARSLKMHLVVVNQSSRVKELGLKDRGDLLSNFTQIRLVRDGWSGKKPACIQYGDRIVEGEWASYFPNAHEGVTLPATAWYTPPPLKDESENAVLSDLENKLLTILQEWDEDADPSLNRLRVMVGARFQSVQEATSRLRNLGFIDEQFGVLTRN